MHSFGKAAIGSAGRHSGRRPYGGPLAIFAAESVSDAAHRVREPVESQGSGDAPAAGYEFVEHGRRRSRAAVVRREKTPRVEVVPEAGEADADVRWWWWRSPRDRTQIRRQEARSASDGNTGGRVGAASRQEAPIAIAGSETAAAAGESLAEEVHPLLERERETAADEFIELPIAFGGQRVEGPLSGCGLSIPARLSWRDHDLLRLPPAGGPLDRCGPASAHGFPCFFEHGQHGQITLTARGPLAGDDVID